MRFYRHRRETLEGAFSLSNAELRVGTISDTRGNLFKGISLYGGLYGPLIGADRAIVLDEQHARSLVEFLDRARRRDFVASFSVSMNLVETFAWSITRYLPHWYDGGGLGGRVSVRALFGASIVPATITSDAAGKLRACIADFYGLGGDS